MEFLHWPQLLPQQTGANNPLNGITASGYHAPTFADIDNDHRTLLKKMSVTAEVGPFMRLSRMALGSHNAKPNSQQYYHSL